MFNSSMKYKWDNKNLRDYEVDEAKKEGEHKKALAIAGKLKKEGLSIEFFAETTGLTIEEIEKL